MTASLSVEEYHTAINLALANAHRPVQLDAELVKANVSQQRVFLEIATKGYRLQCGTSAQATTTYRPGERLVLDVVRPPKIWRNGSVGLWLPADAVHQSSQQQQANVKEARCEQHVSTLREQALLERQKQSHILCCARRIFLVTAKKSDAYADFCDELQKAAPNVCWDVHALDTVVQGRECVASVQGAFAYIQAHATEADVVVLTRGGGSPEDLAAFDTLEVAQCVAQCPLPVLTAIGHHRDNNLCDRVAYHACKTPTAVATHLVQHVQLLCDPLERKREHIKRMAARNREQRQKRLTQYRHRLARMRAARPLARRLHVAEHLHRIRSLCDAARHARTLQCHVTTTSPPQKIILTDAFSLAQYGGQPVRVTLPCGWVVEGILSRSSPGTA